MKGGYGYLAMGLVVLVASAEVFGAEAQVVTGKVEAVTLYRGQALVTRTVPLDGPVGAVELVVTDLPMHVVAESLFAEAGPGVEVRAVRYRTRAVGEEPREAVRKLDDDIERVQDLLSRSKKMQQLIAKRETYLDKLERFVAPTMSVELAKGVLNADQVKDLAAYGFEARGRNAEESLKLMKEERDLNKDLSMLKRRRAELTADSSRSIREALLFLQKQRAGNVDVKLSYLVGNAGWSPAYNFRAAPDRRSVAIEYNAIIRQQSGEDWKDVSLVLSTASPALSSQGPGLAPFHVALRRSSGKQVARRQVAQQYKNTQISLNLARVQMGTNVRYRDNVGYNWAMNKAGNEGQLLELQADADALHVLREAPVDLGGPSLSYKLAAHTSVASRSDQQMVRISSTTLASRFYHVATPVLTSYVYREAELKNTAPDALLGGPVSVYLNGRFVGRAEIPTVATGQTFVVGFGADPQLRATRELVDKKERVQGGNREISFGYRLVLENYKNAAVTVRVFDRVPVAEREADLRLTLGEMKDKLADDKLYLRVERPKGILRWDVDVAAGASGEKARIVAYDYRIAFDRSLELQDPMQARGAAMQQEFFDMQKRRQKR